MVPMGSAAARYPGFHLHPPTGWHLGQKVSFLGHTQRLALWSDPILKTASRSSWFWVRGSHEWPHITGVPFSAEIGIGEGWRPNVSLTSEEEPQQPHKHLESRGQVPSALSQGVGHIPEDQAAASEPAASCPSSWQRGAGRMLHPPQRDQGAGTQPDESLP